MRSTLLFGVAAFFLAGQAEVTEILARQDSQNASAIVTSGAVTTTQTEMSTVTVCSAGSECSSDAALSSPTSTVESTGSLNALTVLSCALSPCPASSSQPTNALSVLSSAQATYSPVTSPRSYSFPPALYSSYGLIITSAVDSQSISSTGTSEVASTAVGP
ncbi:hypothetical protein D0868_15809, partial [Hortaea werneckii]